LAFVIDLVPIFLTLW